MPFMIINTSHRFTIQHILRPAGVMPERVSFVMLTEALLELVKAGLGISVMQTWAIAPALQAGVVRAVPITRAGIHRQWSAVTRRDTGRIAYVDAFIDTLSHARHAGTAPDAGSGGATERRPLGHRLIDLGENTRLSILRLQDGAASV
jgi:LysR family transcriptional regulator for metE and metH